MIDKKQFLQSLRKQHKHISDKDINYFIHQMEPISHSKEEYQKALQIWNQFLATRRFSVKQANAVLSANPKKTPNSMGSSLCQNCFNQMPRAKNWCRVCGNQCCQDCIARMRVINEDDPDAKPVTFCQKCDKQYIVAMIIKEQQQNFLLRQKAFLRLAQQQQMIQSLLKIEKHKLITAQQKQGQHKNVLLKKMNEITQLASLNQHLRSEIGEAKKKIEWGEQIQVHLKKKLKRYKKNQTHSFTSSAQQQNQAWAPPQAGVEDQVSVENLNQSIINSILENQVNTQVGSQSKCNCSLF